MHKLQISWIPCVSVSNRVDELRLPKPERSTTYLWLAVIVLPQASGETLFVALSEFLEGLLQVQVLKVAEVNQGLEVCLGLSHRVDLLNVSLWGHAEEGGEGANA